MVETTILSEVLSRTYSYGLVSSHSTLQISTLISSDVFISLDHLAPPGAAFSLLLSLSWMGELHRMVIKGL